MSELNVAVVGCGYWGPNLIRNFAECRYTNVKYVVDLLPERLSKLSRRYPGTEFITELQTALADPELNAVVIATPVHTHYELAKRALLAGKHVLVEKPMCQTSEQCRDLIALAREHKLILMVDHTFVYNGAVQRIRDSIKKKDLGEILYFDSVRINLGLIQSDINVIWDLAPHDLSIMDFLIEKKPVAVHASGVSLVSGQQEELAYLSLRFEDNFIANFHVSWLSPVKIRRILVGGTQKMVVYDDLEATEKVKIYDKGVVVSAQENDENRYRTLVEYRVGDMLAPSYELTEALKKEAEHFAECIINGGVPETPGEAGLRVVSMLEAASLSLRSGAPVRISELEGVGSK